MSAFSGAGGGGGSWDTPLVSVGTRLTDDSSGKADADLYTERMIRGKI